MEKEQKDFLLHNDTFAEEELELIRKVTKNEFTRDKFTHVVGGLLSELPMLEEAPYGSLGKLVLDLRSSWEKENRRFIKPAAEVLQTWDTFIGETDWMMRPPRDPLTPLELIHGVEKQPESPGGILHEEALLFLSYVEQTGCNAIIESGVSASGVSTKYWCSWARQSPGRHVLAVDKDEVPLPCEEAQFFRGDAFEFLPAIVARAPGACVFIDGPKGRIAVRLAEQLLELGASVVGLHDMIRNVTTTEYSAFGINLARQRLLISNRTVFGHNDSNVAIMM